MLLGTLAPAGAAPAAIWDRCRRPARLWSLAEEVEVVVVVVAAAAAAAGRGCLELRLQARLRSGLRAPISWVRAPCFFAGKHGAL